MSLRKEKECRPNRASMTSVMAREKSANLMKIGVRIIEKGVRIICNRFIWGEGGGVCADKGWGLRI